MIDEERIKLMTRMASYEKEEHKKNKAIISFFKSDYVSLQMVETTVASTIAFAVIFALYVLYDFDLFMKEIYKMDMFGFVKIVLVIYAVFMLISLVVTYVLSMYRYNRAMQCTKRYHSDLKKMSRIYDKEE